MFEKITPSNIPQSVASDKKVLAVTSRETGWMQSGVAASVEQTISANERTSLSALIAYVAVQSGQNEFGVERRLADRFNIPNILCLPATEYDNAIRYLVDAI